MTSIGIIGGGIAGLLIASSLLNKGFNITVYEEHKSIGLPRHCTGLISAKVLKELEGIARLSFRDIIIGKFNEYHINLIYDVKNVRRVISLRFHDHIYMIDRVMIEKVIAEEINSSGALINLKTYVDAVHIANNKKVFVRYLRRVGTHVVSHDHVIISEGAKRVLVKKLGLCKSVRNLNALQAIVKTSLRHDLNYVNVLTYNRNKHFFSWIVPLSEHELLIGLADFKNMKYVYNTLKLLMKLYVGNILRVGDYKVVKFFSGLIPLDVGECSLGYRNIFVIGDASSLIKPLSGGGLYVIVNQVKALTDTFNLSTPSVGYYVDKLMELRKTLSMQRTIKKIIDILGGYWRIANLAPLKSFKVYIEDYDKLRPMISYSFLSLLRTLLRS